MKIQWQPVDYKYDPVKNKWMINGEDPYPEVEEEEGYNDQQDPMEKLLHSETMINTPFGMFEVKEAFNPMNHFEFWIGDADFDLDMNFAYIVDNTVGVEGLKIMSRYKFLLTVGKAFTFTKVRAALELNLGILKFSPSILQKKEELAQSGQDWLMYVYPNLKDFEFTVGTEKDFSNKMKNIIELSETSNGILITSNQ